MRDSRPSARARAPVLGARARCMRVRVRVPARCNLPPPPPPRNAYGNGRGGFGAHGCYMVVIAAIMTCRVLCVFARYAELNGISFQICALIRPCLGNLCAHTHLREMNGRRPSWPVWPFVMMPPGHARPHAEMPYVRARGAPYTPPILIDECFNLFVEQFTNLNMPCTSPQGGQAGRSWHKAPCRNYGTVRCLRR